MVKCLYAIRLNSHSINLYTEKKKAHIHGHYGIIMLYRIKASRQNMLKRFFGLALLLALAASLYAAPIDKQAALSNAQSFVQEKGIGLKIKEDHMFKASAGMKSEAPSYYIFNSADEQGFVIVAGDDLLYPILGYSDKGSIDPDNIPDGLAALLNSYEGATLDLRAQEQAGLLTIPATDNPRRAMTLTKNPVEPFLTTYYGHYDPYYNSNPKFDGTTPSACACSTVAIAQILAHFKYPSIIPQADGYTTKTLGIVLETLPAYEIDWNNILPNYTYFSYNQVQSQEISRFMFHIGQYLRSDFKEDSSSPTNYVYNLLRNFGYRCSQITPITGYLMPDWEDLIYNNLLNSRPVIVSGSNIAIGGARHMFIFDGYDQDGFYHVDWGWNGCCQGYFSFSTLSPYRNTSSYAYFKDIWCIYGIQPNTYPVTNNGEDLHASLDLVSFSVNNQNQSVVTGRRNYNGYAETFLQSLALVDDNYKIKKVFEWDSVYLANSSALATKTWSMENLGDVKDGEYSLYAVSRLADGDELWHFDKVRDNATNGMAKAVVQKGTATLTPLPPMSYNSFNIPETMAFYKGAAREIPLNVTNNTMDMVNRRLYIYEDSITPVQFPSINIPAVSTIDYNITYIPKESGDHKLWICTDSLRRNVLFKKDIKVIDAVRYSLNLDSIIIDNYDNEQNVLYGNELRVRVKITNNGTTDYDDYFRILLRTSSWYDTKKPLLHLPAGKSTWVDFDSKDLPYYYTFTLIVYYKTNSAQDANILPQYLYAKNFVPQPAIKIWKEDGKMYAICPTKEKLEMPQDALALDLTTPNIDIPSSIVPNNNPNAFYYVTKPYSTLSSLNQIVNGVADNITLVDTKPCYVPMDFTAKHAQYTRTFEKGFMGKVNENNWTTIVVPFNVDKVYNTVDNVNLTWYKPGVEDGQFWMREFYGEDGYYTYFTDAEEMRANEPYIITVPGEAFGEETSLVGKPLVFSGDNTSFISKKVVADGRSFNFQGSYYKTSTYGNYIYKLDEENKGNYFAYMLGQSEVNPFRCYFTSITEPRPGSRLHVASYIKKQTPTGIINVEETFNGKDNNHTSLSGVYSITGKKLPANPNASAREILSTLPKGIYIINGRKYVK